MATLPTRLVAAAALLLGAACATKHVDLADFASSGSFGERARVLAIYPGVTATIVAPAHLDPARRVDLIIYALPNGNSTAETIGRTLGDGVGWRYDIQNIGAQTRALRARGYEQAVVAYLEADGKSWPSWRATRGYDRANARIVGVVDELRAAVGNPPQLVVTLTGHSGGGSFMFGFIEGVTSLPDWLERIAFLDANYNFDARHVAKLTDWLHRSDRNTLVALAYDDREIMLDGKKVVSDSGGTWRATHRMIDALQGAFPFTTDTLGDFIRYRSAQVELLLHPNPANRILHTEMIGEMNGYMHALLVRRAGYDGSLLRPSRAYSSFAEAGLSLPDAAPMAIPSRAHDAMTGSAFIASLAGQSRDGIEAAIARELRAGNIPSFLRTLRTVEASGIGPDSVKHVVAYEVMPDYLAIGSDDDFVRMPMTPYTAQAFCEQFGFALPTRKMVNDIWAAATTHLDPRPLTVDRDSARTFLQHQRIIEEQLAGVPRGAFVAGIKKDVVVTNKLLEREKRVAIYGWHYLNGQPIQPLYTGHVDWYVDYSHGIRPVRSVMRVDGVSWTFEKLMADPKLAYLVSDEPAPSVARYDH